MNPKYNPPLIDELLAERSFIQCNTVKFAHDPRWYVAKPLAMNGIAALWRRMHHAWLVLTGKAQAYQYIEDRTPVTTYAPEMSKYGLGADVVQTSPAIIKRVASSDTAVRNLINTHDHGATRKN